ncbi:MAG: DMT family transporter [Mycobacteriales bacterium]
MTRRGWLLFGAMGILWGIPYLLIKVAVEDLSPSVIVLARTGIGAVVLLPIAAARGYLRPLLPLWRWLLLFTALEIAGPWLLLTDAETRVSSSLAGMLIAAVPLVSAIASQALGSDDRLDSRRLVGLGVGMAGVAVLLGLDIEGQLGAALEIALVVIGYGTAPQIITRRFATLPSLAVISSSLALTALFYAPIAAVQWPSSVPAAKVLWSVAGLVIACTVAAFLLFFALIAEAGPNRASVITFVNPAVAVVLGVLLLDEKVTLGIVLGFPLVLLGCVLATRSSEIAQPLPAVAEV